MQARAYCQLFSLPAAGTPGKACHEGREETYCAWGDATPLPSERPPGRRAEPPASRPSPAAEGRDDTYLGETAHSALHATEMRVGDAWRGEEQPSSRYAPGACWRSCGTGRRLSVDVRLEGRAETDPADPADRAPPATASPTPRLSKRVRATAAAVSGVHASPLRAQCGFQCLGQR